MKILASLLLLVSALTAAEYPPMGKDIYDVKADAAVDIAEALAIARAENKHVLLKFGANWCVWCHRLSGLLHEDKAVHAALTHNFVLIAVDVDTRNSTKRNVPTIEKYGNPTQHGLPVLVVLDANGELLTTQETGALEEGSAHDPAKVITFLSRWAPRR
ncbi:MAG: thioredoxin family protein [Opitutaceae bacterium]|jgi:thiol:disulfide interchange protein|nr:thioredoxin family protein [Opitutaceae bacterium]